MPDSPVINDETAPWQQLMDEGAACVGSGITERALAAYARAVGASKTDTERALAHVHIAHVHRMRSNWVEARRHAAIGLEFAEASGSDDLAAEALNVEVGIHLVRGRLDEATALSLRGLTLARSPRVRGVTLQNQATVAARRGDLVTARSLLEESILSFRAAHDERGIATSLVNAAVVAQDAGDLEEALDFGDMAITLSRSLLTHDLLLTAIQNQSHVLLQLGRFDEARTMVTEAFGFFTSAGNLQRQAECLEIMGELNLGIDGDRATALRSFVRAKEIADKSGDVILAERLGQRLDALATR